MVVKQNTIDANQCLKPILKILEQVESILSTPSTAHDRSEEIEFQIAKLSAATKESVKRFELKCERLSQEEQQELKKECLNIIDGWNISPNKLDAWVELLYRPLNFWTKWG